ncbi:unnamed protein product [Hymenolepis diminuta]|uniref:Uncharacterized protein n=1 Tax=Hymenolepis diminuta TaxID=6216 RepID=A0A564YE92_HYMDI|nr:unnamed protein product [Hymenolepis diminuta]
MRFLNSYLWHHQSPRPNYLDLTVALDMLDPNIAHQVLDEQPSRSSRVQLSAFFLLLRPSSLTSTIPSFLPPSLPSYFPSLPFSVGLVLFLPLGPWRSPPMPRTERCVLLRSPSIMREDLRSLSSPQPSFSIHVLIH